MAGRPLRADAKTVVASVRLSPAERQLAEQAAKVNSQKFGDFVRSALVCAAAECLELPPKVRRP